MSIIVPNTASILASSGCVVGSQNKWIWVGLLSAFGASGSATFFMGASSAGCQLIQLANSACNTQTMMYGPFNSACGVSVGNLATACAVVWMKQ